MTHKSNINISTLRTAEFVSPGHPDKICDQISDAILDAHLTQDPDARVAVDVAGGHGIVFVTGEVTSRAKNIDIAQIVQRLAGDVKLIENITTQSPEIARGVDIGGAGDQGIMVGYACDETTDLLPREYVLAARLCKFIYYGQNWHESQLNNAKTQDGFWTDGKTQITLQDNKIDTIVASFQTPNNLQGKNIGEILKNRIKTWLKIENEPTNNIKIITNPCGDWEIGGFAADAGLTGRKLVVDNYGPRIPIGGGALSGKDPSKVDRSAAYMARKIAVDYLRKRSATEVYAYLAYAIGKAEPVAANVVIDGISEVITGYDLTPNGIIQSLDLKQPKYEALARNGHHFLPI